MKKYILLTLLFALPLLFAACEKNDPKKEEEINETTLRGTWEGAVEHDYGQGYQQKYRVAFDGKSYTMWHMHQEADKDGLHNVGDKYKGTWSYANGKITFKATEWSASHFISSLSPLEYTFYSYDVNTMEASPWYVSSFADTLEDAVWTVSLKSGKLQAKINMDTFVLQKKN